MAKARSRQLLSLTAAFVALGMTGCGQVGSNPDVRLGVPYRAQAAGSLDCGPASVLMWRLYDGLSEISQSEIASWMGGTCNGVTQDGIAAAVNHFTLTFDAFWDFEGESEENFMSRQITSIDSYTPVIAIISFLHAGVVNGGKWHELSTGRYQWDYVYFHDPLDGPNVYYVADDWIATNCPTGSPCEQIASTSASGAAAYNLGVYGDKVQVGGSCGESCGTGGGPYSI